MPFLSMPNFFCSYRICHREFSFEHQALLTITVSFQIFVLEARPRTTLVCHDVTKSHRQLSLNILFAEKKTFLGFSYGKILKVELLLL